MRTVINFSVVGGNVDELKAKARETYRDLLGDPEAEIPYSATIEVSPETVVENGDGRQVATEWKGEVNITLSAEGGAR
jgi:hypothetical protein